jgi:hypothetical protein
VEKKACERPWEEILGPCIEGSDSERKHKLSRLSSEVDNRRLRLNVARWTLVTINGAFITVYLSYLLFGVEFPYLREFLEPNFVNAMYAIQLAAITFLSPLDGRFLFSNRHAITILGKSVQESDLEIINSHISSNFSTEKAIALMSAFVLYFGLLDK